MGYYTGYKLEVLEGDPFLISDFIESSESASYALTSEGETKEDCSWYAHEDELRKFSRLHPTTLFKLPGEGEESGDIWVKYFKSGKMQECRAQIVIPDYDESKLS